MSESSQQAAIRSQISAAQSKKRRIFEESSRSKKSMKN